MSGSGCRMEKTWAQALMFLPLTFQADVLVLM